MSIPASIRKTILKTLKENFNVRLEIATLTSTNPLQVTLSNGLKLSAKNLYSITPYFDATVKTIDTVTTPNKSIQCLGFNCPTTDTHLGHSCNGLFLEAGTQEEKEVLTHVQILPKEGDKVVLLMVNSKGVILGKEFSHEH